MADKTITATFQIVTPMFIGDASHNAVDIRPPSVKGALRFWWRALNWGRCRAVAQDDAAALRQLHDDEARLFGLAVTDKAGGQGVFLLNVMPGKLAPSTVPYPNEKAGSVMAYLIGQGLIAQRDKPARQAFPAGGEFSVQLRFKPKPTTTTEDRASVADALYLFGLLGALGSRARHGMGSVALTAWDGGRKIPTTASEYKTCLAALLGKLPTALPPFTALSQKSRIDIVAQARSAERLLSDVGTQQMLERSFGNNGRVLGQASERNFTPDHDAMRQVTKGARASQAPQRIVYGLPHNYFFSSTKSNVSSTRSNVDVNYAPDGKDGRRASPLFLHIHQLGDGEFIAVHCLMPAQFLPDRAQIRIKSGSNQTSNVPVNVDWQVLHDYLDRFDSESIYGSR